MNGEPLIGPNIIKARQAKGWTQKRLADETKISPASLSSYEHDRQMPSLATLAKIARALGVSIDSLYFGDSDIAEIATAESKGRTAAYAISKLWSMGILGIPVEKEIGSGYDRFEFTGIHVPMCFKPVNRFLNRLEEFKQNESTYPDPDAYLKQLIGSVANEIDEELKWHSR